MKRAIILALFLFLSETSGICATTFFPPLQPLNSGNGMQNYTSSVTTLPDPFAKSTATNSADLTKIETSIYGKTYPNQSMSSRLSRIEKSLFSTTYPNASEAQRIDNIISNYNQINKYPNISSSELSRIESKVFKQNFPQNNPKRRIERLEEQLFGATQSGDINVRFEALKIASKSCNLNKTASARDSWGNMGGNPLSSMFGGSMTGFTPPITPYYNPYSNYGNNTNTYSQLGNLGGGGYGSSQRIRTNHGYLDSDGYQNFNTGTGVTILD